MNEILRAKRWEGSTPGTGSELAIVRGLVEAIDGALSLAPFELGGLRIVLGWRSLHASGRASK